VTSESKFIGSPADLQAGDVFTFHDHGRLPGDAVTPRRVRVADRTSAVENVVDVLPATPKRVTVHQNELIIERPAAAEVPAAAGPPFNFGRIGLWVAAAEGRTADFGCSDEGWELRLYNEGAELAARGAARDPATAVAAAFDGLDD
jgi:hypothetical protein